MRIARTQGRGATALLAALFLAGGAAAEPVGFLAVADGSVEIKGSGATSFAAAAVDHDVEIGDTIRTGRASLAKLLLVDDTTITIDEETELVIDHYVVGPAATTEPSRVSLVSGHVRTKVGEAFGGRTRLQMHTPTAVIGVKGTEWLTWYLLLEETTLVCVISGRVSMEALDPAFGGEYEPPVGKCARVLPHARPEEAEFPGMLPVSAPRGPVGAIPSSVVQALSAPVETGPRRREGGPEGYDPGGDQEGAFETGDKFTDQADLDAFRILLQGPTGPPAAPPPEPDDSPPSFGTDDTAGGFDGFGTGDTR